MKNSTKIILGSVIAVFLLGCLAVACLVGGIFYLDKENENRIENQNKAEAAGTEFGKTTDQNGCMEKTYSLEPPLNTFDRSRMFIRECLNSSRPTPNFCEGVMVSFNNKWQDEECRKIGRETALCHAAFDGKMNFCEKHDKRQ